MPRRTKSEKPYIIVFCEGESEQAYTDFLKKEFRDVASIKRPSATGLFEEADSKFKKDKLYRDYAEVTDEVWFFFDVETEDIASWDARLKIIKRLRSLRKKPGIKVRLLMTTGCIEYWLMLHYKMYTPPIQTVAEKEHVMERLLTKEPNYKKGDADITARIAQRYHTAARNARKTVSKLTVGYLNFDEDGGAADGLEDKVAKKVASLSDYPMHHLGAVVVKKHKIISTGYNSGTRCHYIQKTIDERRFGCSCDGKVHAEVSALIPLIKRKTDLSDATLYIGRYYKNGDTALAKPCVGCMTLLKECGIRKIYYTTDGGYAKLNIN